VTRVLACVLVVMAGCSDPGREAPLVGEPPIECEPLPATGSDDVVPAGVPLAILVVRLPARDPDCSSPAVIVEQSAALLTWYDAGAERDEVVATVQTSSWSRAGDSCRIQIGLAYRGGPSGHAGTIQPCDARMLSAQWASFADIPVDVTTIAIDGLASAAAWPAPWAEATADGADCTPAAPIEREALGLELDVELSIALADWRRLHSTAPPVLAIRAAITVP
jgi:hypothetical protein